MFNTISLFSGGGGLDLGFKQEGFDIVYAIDNDKHAVSSYKHNIDDVITHDDITNIDKKTLPTAPVVIGGPPCQSFSLAGKRDKNDERSDLVWRYIDIIKVIKPAIFLFENVIGLNSAKTPNGNNVLDELKYAFNKIGYHLDIETLNAADYGVPQRRKRIFIVGHTNSKPFYFPETTHNEKGDHGKNIWVSSEDAIGDLGSATKDGVSDYSSIADTPYRKLMRKDIVFPIVTNHFKPQMSNLDKEIISFVKPGGNYNDIPDTVISKRISKLKETGGRTTSYGRLLADKPAYTINTHFNRPNVGCNIHYKFNRLITVREALRFQSFPDDYEIISSTKRGYHTIVGNAVPPLLSRLLAKEIKNYLV